MNKVETQAYFCIWLEQLFSGSSFVALHRAYKIVSMSLLCISFHFIYLNTLLSISVWSSIPERANEYAELNYLPWEPQL